MIATKITNPKKSAAKSARVNGLTDYIIEPQRNNSVEKCIASGAENFLTATHVGQKAEMIALAEEAVRSKDPIDHFVMSWKHNERPTPAQAKEAVEIFVEHCGLVGHQYKWGLHDDTENMHVHIAINRVHPDTLKVIEINKGFDREATQQAIALIEHRQGWSKEKNARYQTDSNGKLVMDKKTNRPEKRLRGPSKQPEPSNKAKAMELQTGEKSAQRIGIEQAAPIIASAKSWRELHEQMAAAGMQYERKGSGAIVHVGDVPVKASDVSRAASLSALQKRLGPYQPQREISKNEYHDTSRNFTDANAKEQNAFETGKVPGNGLRSLSKCVMAHSEKTNANGLNSARVLQIDARPGGRAAGGLRRDTGRRTGVERSEGLHGIRQESSGSEPDNRRAEQAVRRGAGGPAGSSGTTASRAVGMGTSDNVGRRPVALKENQPGWEEYTLIRDEQKANKIRDTTELQARHSAERAALTAKLKETRAEVLKGDWRGKGSERNRKQSALAVVQAIQKLELAVQHKAERAALIGRYAPLPTYKEWKEQPLIVSEAVRSPSEQQVIRNSQPAQLAQMLRSLSLSTDLLNRNHVTYKLAGKSVFRDEGRTIKVLDLKSDIAIAAALATAQQKFGYVLTLTGSTEFQHRTVAVAVASGLTVKFADPALEVLRERLQAEQRQVERNARATPAPVASATAINNRLIPAPAAAEPVQQSEQSREAGPLPLVADPVADDLADIHKQIAAAASSKHAVPATDAPHEKRGSIVASNETFVAVSTGRDEITIYRTDQLAGNLDYDGIATGPYRFAVGNQVEFKHRHDGSTKSIVSEEREALQTDERKKRDHNRRGI